MRGTKGSPKCCNILIMVCIIALLATGCIAHLINVIKKPQKTEITCVIQTDSLGQVSIESRAYIDSIMQVFSTREQRFENRYEFFMQQREQYQDFFSCTGFIVTIILAVLGFLGYNSLSSMEGRLKAQLGSSIKDKVRAVVENEVKNKFESYKEQTAEKINGDIQLFEEKFEHYKDSASNKIRSNIADKMTKFYPNIEKRINQRVKEKYNPTLDEIGNLKSEISRLNRLVNELAKELAKDNPALTINSPGETTDSNKVQEPPLVSHTTELVDENLLSYNPDPFNSNKTKE